MGARQVDRQDRKCTLCNVIEDEFHCLIECPRFTNGRKGNLPECLKNNPSMFKFIHHLNTTDFDEQSRLGKLCFQIQIKHKSYI